MSFRWKNRTEYIKRTAMLAYLDYKSTAEWCVKNPDTTPAVNRNQMMDILITDYSRNAEWMPRRSTVAAWADICLEAFELARMDKDEQAQEYFWMLGRGAKNA